MYVLATLMAQGLHDHGREADALAVESRGGCDDAGPHFGDHEVDDHRHAPPGCPSCQFRGQHSLAELAPRPRPGPGIAIPPATDAPPPAPGAPLRTRCRAPPRD